MQDKRVDLPRRSSLGVPAPTDMVVHGDRDDRIGSILVEDYLQPVRKGVLLEIEAEVVRFDCSFASRCEHGGEN
jgi:hypothetical protein